MQTCSVVRASLPARLSSVRRHRLNREAHKQLPQLARWKSSAGWGIKGLDKSSCGLNSRLRKEGLAPLVANLSKGVLSTRALSCDLRDINTCVTVPSFTECETLLSVVTANKAVSSSLLSSCAQAPGGMAPGEWECTKCTFLNDEGLESCELCEEAREQNGAQAAEEGKKRKRDADDLTGDHSARVAILGVDESKSKLGGSKRTVIVLDDDDSPGPKTGLTGKRPLVEDNPGSSQGGSGGGEGTYSLLHELHLERLARQAARQGGASGEASTSNRPSTAGKQEKASLPSSRGGGASSLGSGQERAGSSTFARPDLDDEDFGSRKTTRVFGRGVSSQAGQTGLGPQEPLVILSYNVWFNEQVALERRMGAIGAIIEEHSPHVVFFQEVTPNIYSIFRQARWWSRLGYKCSLAPSQIDRQYFAMMVTRLPVKTAFHHEPFPNSVMGRDLVTASVAVGDDVELTLATTHLESPTGRDQLFSEPRVAQARTALASLARKRNVIFGGDMNWNDERDGPMPLPDGWVDPWLELHRGQPGFTYDSVLNQMLLGNLKGRLDRFLCRLPDCTVQSVEMVGKQPIPGLTYEKPGWGRFPKSKTLPVLPSDHFGLLLKVVRREG